MRDAVENFFILYIEMNLFPYMSNQANVHRCFPDTLYIHICCKIVFSKNLWNKTKFTEYLSSNANHLSAPRHMFRPTHNHFQEVKRLDLIYGHILSEVMNRQVWTIVTVPNFSLVIVPPLLITIISYMIDNFMYVNLYMFVAKVESFYSGDLREIDTTVGE